jgi:hypothetical protein
MLFCHMLTSKMCLDFNQIQRIRFQPDLFDGRGPLLQHHPDRLLKATEAGSGSIVDILVSTLYAKTE